MEMNFSETAEDNLAMAGEREEMMRALAEEGAEEMEEARLEAEARRHNGFFSRE